MRLFIKYKFYVLLLVVTGMALLINACKKDNSATVSRLLTAGSWQLAGVTRQSFVGDTLKNTDTLNVNCNQNINQLFTFKTDNSCTFNNYNCITQTSAGTWGLTPDNLVLTTTLKADTSTTVKESVFGYCQIINLGQYSFVIQTGDTSPYYTSKTKRVITRWAFVHPNNQ